MRKNLKKLFLLSTLFAISSIQAIDHKIEHSMVENQLFDANHFSLARLWIENSLFIKDAIIANLRNSPTEELDVINGYLEKNANDIGHYFSNESEIAELIKEENQAIIQYIKSFDEESVLAPKLLGRLIKIDQRLLMSLQKANSIKEKSIDALLLVMGDRLELIVCGSQTYCKGEFLRAYGLFQELRRRMWPILVGAARR